MAPPLFFLNSDARVLDLIRKGDEKGLVALYNANRMMIASYITRNHGSKDDAEDMLQEALVVLWERVRSGQFEYTAKLSTFIFATVKNMWLRKLARSKKETPLEIDPEEQPDETATPLENLLESEEAALVQKALARIGEQCKKLLLLFYWEKLSMEEIAVQMGFANAETAKSKKYQCKKALAQMLQKQL